MIEKSIVYIQKRLNEYLKTRFGINEDIVVVSGLLDEDGEFPASLKNKISISLARIGIENNLKNTVPNISGTDNRIHSFKSLIINNLILVSSHFRGSNYLKGLNILSAIIQFFMNHPVFNQQNAPGLDPTLSKIEMVHRNLSLEETDHLWSLMGSNYLPSALYNLRMTTAEKSH